MYIFPDRVTFVELFRVRVRAVWKLFISSPRTCGAPLREKESELQYYVYIYIYIIIIIIIIIILIIMIIYIYIYICIYKSKGI